MDKHDPRYLESLKLDYQRKVEMLLAKIQEALDNTEVEAVAVAVWGASVDVGKTKLCLELVEKLRGLGFLSVTTKLTDFTDITMKMKASSAMSTRRDDPWRKDMAVVINSVRRSLEAVRLATPSPTNPKMVMVLDQALFHITADKESKKAEETEIRDFAEKVGLSSKAGTRIIWVCIGSETKLPPGNADKFADIVIVNPRAEKKK